MRRLSCALVLFPLLGLAQKAPFNVDALLKIKRISEPQLAPDASSVVFTVQTVNLEKNSKPRQLYSVPLDGGTPRQLTFDSDGNNERPRWLPDASGLLFISTRTGSSQIWSMHPDGSGAKQVLDVPTEASGLILSADAKYLVFLSSVYPECSAKGRYDADCNKRAIEDEAKSPTKARIYTSLLYRHWTQYQGRRRQHLLSAPLEGGAIVDLTPGAREVPPFSLGGSDDYAISPESTEVCYISNADADLSTSTNSDLFVVPITGGESKRITNNAGADNGPTYSPDGKYLAYRSQARAGFEADRWRLMVLERSTGRLNGVTDSFDRSVTSITWTPDSKRIFFVNEDRGHHPLQMISVTGGGLKSIVNGPLSVDDAQFSPDAKTLIYTESSGTSPTEIMKVSSSGGAPVALTHINDALMDSCELSKLEEIAVEGADGARIQAFIVKPPAFNAKRKYPVLFLIHGGPQSSFGESWGYRWNPQVFAAAGFVTVMANPRGSTGFGQKFTDEVSGDWGGKAYDDIMAVVDYMGKQPYTDATKMAAAGGSYGGYMVNWIAGHSDRFKALVSHAGVFDLRSMAGETEELWFPIWEFKGMPWQNAEMYSKWSPSYSVENFKTPTLVIHGELDYRVPVGQGMQMYTALKMQKVPSKLLLYPDEGHWILKPANTVLWYQSFIDWITEWTKSAGGGRDAK